MIELCHEKIHLDLLISICVASFVTYQPVYVISTFVAMRLCM